MSALTVNTDRRVEGGITRFGPLIASEITFQGSLLGFDQTTGFIKRMAPGLLFFGISEKGSLLKDASAVNGGYQVQCRTGMFKMVVVLAGVTQADIASRRRVYASSDNDLSLTAEAGNTYIGDLTDMYNQFGGVTNGVVINAKTIHNGSTDTVGGLGSAVLADAAVTLSTQQLDLLLYCPNTAARTLTLPAVAQCTGRTFNIVKTTAAAFSFTLQCNAAENINGVNTYVSAAAQYSVASIRSDGTQWLVVSKI
jgi:hypothetical protein